MKKKLFPHLMLVALMACVFVACEESEDSSASSKYASQFFSVETGTFHNGAMPESTSDEAIEGIEMNEQALANGSNFIMVTSEQAYDCFYISVEGEDGYIEVPVTNTRSGSYNYIIPLNYGSRLSKNIVMLVKARTPDGRITKVYRQAITFVESMEGALTINLTFSKPKDLDLHLRTPSGKHIFYNAKEWKVTNGDTEIIYGLDHDSNASCNIDNLNNENIVIPEEAIEPGEYEVFLVMYANCDTRINTELDWRVTVRYKGQPVKNTLRMPTIGENSIAFNERGSTLEGLSPNNNPVWGRYHHAHPGSTQKPIMTFKVKDSTRGMATPQIENISKPSDKADYELMPQEN